MEKKNNEMNRRKFLKLLGTGATVVSTAFYGCQSQRKDISGSAQSEIPTDKMTCRVNPTTGDKVSILGYGCMRLPTIPVEGKEGEDEIDQEMVNRQVDFALAHGLNYFDTSPAYCKGRSERAMGIALSRHPRSSYFIATKLSNFSPATWTREASLAMYRNSLKELQVDYIDYMLLHGVGIIYPL